MRAMSVVRAGRKLSTTASRFASWSTSEQAAQVNMAAHVNLLDQEGKRTEGKLEERDVFLDIGAGATVCALGSNLSDHTRLSALRG